MFQRLDSSRIGAWGYVAPCHPKQLISEGVSPLTLADNSGFGDLV